MAKDSTARAEGRITVLALGNLTAAIVDAMQDAGLPPGSAHRFIDRLEQLNQMTLWGRPAEVMLCITATLRRSVASND